MPRKKFEPTDDMRQNVKALIGFGVSQQQICMLIGIRSRKTLRKQFRKELEVGVIEATAAVQQTAFRLAASGRNPKMTRRWLERWQQRSRRRQLGHEVERPRHVKWIVETYQPPVPDNPQLSSLLAALKDKPVEPWDGDSPDDPNS